MPEPTAIDRFTRSTTFERLARLGYVARGALYVLMGALALAIAVGVRPGDRPDQQGAIHAVLRRPGGTLLVFALAVGFAGYAIWRLTQAIVGRTPEHGAYEATERVAAAASGLTYTFFFGLALAVLGGRREQTKPSGVTADALTWPGGRAIVAIVGAAIIGVGAYQLKVGAGGDFEEYSKTHQMRRESMLRPFFVFGRIGYAARASVFALVGIFLVKAAVVRNPGEAVGVDGAILRLLRQPWGSWLVALVAAGLLVFGAYSLLDSRYRKI